MQAKSCLAIIGTAICGILGICCALTRAAHAEPVMVDVDYMNDRIRRQRKAMSQAWKRSGPGDSEIERFFNHGERNRSRPLAPFLNKSSSNWSERASAGSMNTSIQI